MASPIRWRARRRLATCTYSTPPCPLVTKVHSQGRHYVRQGRRVVLIGHVGHPEVEGTLGQISGPVDVVQSEADVAALALPADTPIAYVTQTTLSVDDTRGVIEALKRRFSDVVGPGTQDICYATQNRQSALRELTKRVDVIFVVGAKNSSNSNRLREIGEEAGKPTYLIANGAEIRPEWVEGAQAVGITAGASAPEIMVSDAIDALARIASVEVSTLPGEREQIEFRVPVELLDVNNTSKIGKDEVLSIPLLQKWAVGSYVVRQHLAGRKRYPLVLMLEPLFRCNLACAGCGKIDYPDEILNQRISVKDALEAVDEMRRAGGVDCPAASRCCTRSCRRSSRASSPARNSSICAPTRFSWRSA